ncbi:thiol peroxidase (atypical 2-Cys peroxiredoxin) [Kushneria sinocarnis]|uniref:Thiol peroxidase (Atypical 2-Cys peroxiredoxin) n=1 Tax=Kushneria sinocarnis TaxID=595502 RepID=A0A420WV75_9GAMM|nr:thiol peroxidase [Kushneria sinocarnis]RKR02445.1 thiol peroxidase (atypical 2-Cys peroxiredoxin) [Kushneria sinocarnis]
MNQVKFGDTQVDVKGTFPQPGDTAKPFTLTGQDLEEVQLGDFSGQRKVLSIIPSVDTGTCAMSTRKFNERATALDNTVVLVISADLPFAAARFCGAEGLEGVRMLSTFRHHDEFTNGYGVGVTSGPIRGLCARAVIVLDENDRVLHSQLVEQIRDEPDYDAALAVL